MNKLAPSILSADFTKLGEQIKEIEEAGAEYLHIDVMDGSFVPSISFGMPVISSIRSATRLLFDVHLMIQAPERYIKEFAKIGADSITIQAESCTHLHRTVSMIKECGKKVGIALNPATPLSVLDYMLPDIDMVLIMTVNPGYGGQKFIPFSYEKIKEVKKKIDLLGLEIDIQVDGGISIHNAKKVIEAGATILVAGTAVFCGNIKENVKVFQDILRSSNTNVCLAVEKQ